MRFEMYKKIGLSLALALVISTYGSASYAITNPLKSYNLYEDTKGRGDSERESVMSEYYQNSLRAPKNVPSTPAPTYNAGVSKSNTKPSSTSSTSVSVQAPQRRNDYLRESSKKVYGNKDTQAGWISSGKDAKTFYPNPTLVSIRNKYKQSNFTGSMQEAISYIQKNPKETLAYYYLAMSYAKANDKENAIKAYEKVIALNSNPMIVKYATNGRNCVMNNESEAKCFQDVNVPELKYPYREMAQGKDLTPVDPQTLINRNINALQAKLNPAQPAPAKGKDGKPVTTGLNLPFGNQDDELDKFINAPYGNGLSPELYAEQRKQKLKQIQENINNEQNGFDSYFENFNNIKNFDNQKSESDSIKLAYDNSSFDFESLKNNPEFIQNQKEIDQLNMLFGETKSSSKDLMDLIPYMTKEGSENISPEVVKNMMMQSVMPDIIGNDII